MQYITHDARSTNKSNLRIRKSSYDINTVELISYNTVVAYGVLDNRSWNANELGHLSIFEMIHDADWFFTERKYSSTTSKQVTRFLNAVCGGRANATELEHETFRKALTDFTTKDEVQYA